MENFLPCLHLKSRAEEEKKRKILPHVHLYITWSSSACVLRGWVQNHSFIHKYSQCSHDTQTEVSIICCSSMYLVWWRGSAHAMQRNNSVVVCRLNEWQMLIWTTCGVEWVGQVVDIYDWRVCGIYNYKWLPCLSELPQAPLVSNTLRFQTFTDPRPFASLMVRSMEIKDSAGVRELHSLFEIKSNSYWIFRRQWVKWILLANLSKLNDRLKEVWFSSVCCC